MPLKLNSSGGGSVTLDVPSTASTFTATVPANNGTLVTTGSTAAVTQGMLAAGVAGNGPAFSATRTGQSISTGTFTKIVFTSETFDTAGAFDPATGRFTPLAAGYYQFDIAFSTDQLSGGIFCEVRRNNTRMGVATLATHVAGLGAVSSGSFLVFLNGTTDYAEMIGYQSSGSTVSTFSDTIFSGFLARAA